MAAERTVMFQLPSLLSGTLACIGGTVAGRSWELSAGTFVIGRNDTCDLVLANEPGVSKVHAKIVAEGDRYVLADCESRNGTIVNGSPIQKQALQDGDEVRICGCVLRFAQNGGNTAVRVRNVDQRLEATDPSQNAPPARMSDVEPAAFDGTLEQQGQPGSQSQSAPQAPAARGKVLALWYAFGLVGSLVFGGTATVVVVLSAEPAQAEAELGTDSTAALAKAGDAAKTDAAKTDAAADAAKAGDATNAASDAAKAVDATKPADAAAVNVDAAAADAKADEAKAADAKAEEAKADDAKADDAKADDAKADDAKADDTKAKGVAEAEKELAVAKDDEPAADKVVEKKSKRRASSTSSASSASSASTPSSASSESSDEVEEAAPAAGSSKAFRASVDGGKSEALRTKGGKVRSVDVKDGEIVSKGQVLVTFDEGENADEIATLRDRIASLEGAEDDEARRDLKAAKDKLAALTGSKSAPIIAGMAGRITGFNVSSGAVLKSGEVVGRIVEGDAPRRVKVSVDRATKPRKGQEVTLVLKRGGEGVGNVLAVSGKSVTVDTGDLNADEVESVRF